MTPAEKLHYDIFLLFKYGNIEEGEKLMEENRLDYLETSPNDKWNWLHQLLMSINSNDKTKPDVIKFFIEKGVPINAQDIHGMTPLHYAMRSRNADAAIALLEAGADPNIPDKDNLRPLSMVGYTKDRLDVLELMLKKGGDIHNIINQNETILESKKPNNDSPQWKNDIYEMMKKYS